jgi:hypothetical protein
MGVKPGHLGVTEEFCPGNGCIIGIKSVRNRKCPQNRRVLRIKIAIRVKISLWAIKKG